MDNIISAYRSPVRLVTHAAEPVHPFSQQSISRAKKKLLAEIALSGDEIILDGISYSRNDVLSLLDTMDEDRWHYHCIIYSQEGLLDFLEKNIFDADKLEKAYSFRYKPGFTQFVSPWFAYSFNEASGRLLRQNEEYETLALLMNDAGFILPEHGHEAYQRIRNYLDDLLYTLRNLSWEKFEADESVLHFIFSHGWMNFINKLPSAFTSFRDELAEQMLAIVYRFQHKATWYYLNEVCIRLQQIDCGPSWRTEINKYQNIMQGNTAFEGRKGSGKNWSWGRGAFWIIWIVASGVFRASNGCNDDSPNYHFDNNSLSVVASSVKNELNSSRNEQEFKTFLTHFSSSAHRGSPMRLKTGATPFLHVSKIPSQDGKSTLFLKNETQYDVLLFYFSNDNLLIDTASRVSAVYIKAGENYRMHFEPNFGRFNLALGKHWTALQTPAAFSLARLMDNGSGSYSAGPSWSIDQYFGSPLAVQPLLTHDILIQNFKQSFSATAAAPTPTPVYEPPQYTNNEGEAELDLKERAGKIEMKGSGPLFIYQSPPKFSE